MTNVLIKRIGAKSVPIPSPRELEADVLVDKTDIIRALQDLTRVS